MPHATICRTPILQTGTVYFFAFFLATALRRCLPLLLDTLQKNDPRSDLDYNYSSVEKRHQEQRQRRSDTCRSDELKWDVQWTG